MPVSIRPFRPDDYGGFAHVVSRYWDEPTSAETLRWHDQHRDPRSRAGRWVAEAGGRVVGFAEFFQRAGAYHPRKFEVNVAVLPEWRRQSIGRALRQVLQDALLPADPVSLAATVRETEPEGARFAQAAGFTERMRHWESHLDLQRWDGAVWMGAIETAARGEYTVESYADLAVHPDRDRRIHDLLNEVRRDVPNPEPLTDLPFEQWAASLRSPHFWPAGLLVARKGAEMAGLSHILRTDEEGVLVTDLTAVRRVHRSTGIALALKVHGLLLAWRAGYRRMKTWNAAHNERILALNAKLGFVRQPAWIHYVRQIHPEG